MAMNHVFRLSCLRQSIARILRLAFPPNIRPTLWQRSEGRQDITTLAYSVVGAVQLAESKHFAIAVRRGWAIHRVLPEDHCGKGISLLTSCDAACRKGSTYYATNTP